MPRQASRSLLLSLVSSEFRSYRLTLAKDLKRPNLEIKTQEDFIVTGGTTLAKLDLYVQSCDAVIHLIGQATGFAPPPEAVAELLARYPDLPARLPALVPELPPAPSRLSYTQWEAYLALYHGRPLFIYLPTDDAPRDDTFRPNPDEAARQAAHLARLSGIDRDRGTIPDQRGLSIAVLRDLVEILPRLDEPVRESNVPEPEGEFVGRDRDRQRLIDHLITQNRRLVTITGTGGIGKTRLACEVGLAVRAPFPGGCYFVELKELREPAHLAAAVADALGLRLDQAGDPTEVLARMLREREPTLLILDNLELVPDLADRSVRLWHGAAPKVRFLVTSRKALGVPGEVLHPLAPLELPSVEHLAAHELGQVLNVASARLFLNTVAAQGVDLPADGDTPRLVAQICRKLDGQPLAIILVARRIREFSLDELAAEVDESRVLAAESDGQALADTIQWSYDRLTGDGLQEAFQRLCVFREGFDREAAAALLRDLGERLNTPPSLLLQRLCEYSLVEVVRRGKVTRYQLFQTIQDFGRRKWPTPGQEPPEWAAAWLAHYAQFAEKWSPLVPTSRGPEALALLVEERENILAAHTWGLAHGQTTLAARLILGFAPVLQQRGPWQIQTALYLRTLDALPPDALELRIRLLNVLSEARWCEGSYPDAHEYAKQAVQLATQLGSDVLLAESLLEEGERSEDLGDREAAMRCYEAGLAAATRSGATVFVAAHNGGMAYLYDRFGDYDLALEKIRSATAALERVDELHTLSKTVNREGLILWHQGRPDEALAPLRKAEELFQRTDNPRWRAGAISNIGLALIDADRLDESLHQFTTAAPLHLAQGNVSWWAVNQAGHGSALILLDRPDQAIELLENALEIARQTRFQENIGLIYGLLGRAWARKAEWARAEAAFTEALEIEDRIKARDRRHAGNLIQRSLARLRQGRLDDARTDFAATREQIERLGLAQLTHVRLVREDLAVAAILEEELR